MDYIAILIFLFAITVVCPYCVYEGWSDGKDQQWFRIITQSPSSKVAVLCSYGDYLLTVPIIRNHNDPSAHFDNKFVIVKMPDVQTPLSISFEKVGPLKPEDVKPVEVKPAA